MKKNILIFLLCLVIAGITLAIAIIPPIYAIAVIFGLVIVYSIFLKIIKPILIISIVFICAPFIDVLRAAYLANMPFIGIYQELILVLLLISILINSKDRTRFRRLGLIDYLVILYVIWNFIQVFQSPSFLGGLYVWRWYSIGPLTYLIFRFYSFTKNECAVVISSICIGLVAASMYIFYQYFVLGPEKAVQISQSLGFTSFYRIGWRLTGSFGSPLIASASYSILILFGVALLSMNRYKWVGLFLIVLGGLAIFITLSRSGIVIGFVGLLAILLISFKKMKFRIILIFSGILLTIQLSYIIPETRQFLRFITNTNLDYYDTGRIEQFNYIFTNAITEHPLGIGFAGGGAISLAAYEIFGGDSTNIPEYFGGDSVLLATLQTSGFIGFFLLIAIYSIFIRCNLWLLSWNLIDVQRVICLVSLGFFLGTLASLGNLIDVWPIKLYLWSFGAIVINFKNESSLFPAKSSEHQFLQPLGLYRVRKIQEINEIYPNK